MTLTQRDQFLKLHKRIWTLEYLIHRSGDAEAKRYKREIHDIKIELSKFS
jgi:hypothetical protein